MLASASRAGFVAEDCELLKCAMSVRICLVQLMRNGNQLVDRTDESMQVCTLQRDAKKRTGDLFVCGSCIP